MKPRIWQTAAASLLLLAGFASPAAAGGGLPVITSFQSGHADVTVYGDSLQLHTGTNTLTIEATGLVDGSLPELSLVSPDGTVLPVPLEPMHIVAGPDGGHGDSHGDTHSDAPADDHDTAPADHHDTAPADHHDTAPADHHDAAPATDHGHGAGGGGEHGAVSTEAAWFRGKVTVRTTGMYKAQLQVNGKAVTDDVKVINNGPSRPYLAVTGLAMGGTIIYGAIMRRRQPNGKR